MAGSYKHITDGKNNFRGTGLLDHLGDAYGALEECWYLINFLAQGDKNKIKEAHLKYINVICPSNVPMVSKWDFFDADDVADPDSEDGFIAFDSIDWKANMRNEGV